MDAVLSSAVEGAVGGEVVDFPGVAGLQMEGGAGDRQRRPGVGLKRHVDLVGEVVLDAAVRVRVDAVSGGEACEHGLGIDWFGVAVGRGGLRHDREQPAPPEVPARIDVVAEPRLVQVDEPEDDVPGVGEAEEVVFPDGALPAPHRVGEPGDCARKGAAVHGCKPSHRVRLVDRLHEQFPRISCSERTCGQSFVQSAGYHGNK